MDCIRTNTAAGKSPFRVFCDTAALATRTLRPSPSRPRTERAIRGQLVLLRCSTCDSLMRFGCCLLRASEVGIDADFIDVCLSPGTNVMGVPSAGAVRAVIVIESAFLRYRGIGHASVRPRMEQAIHVQLVALRCSTCDSLIRFAVVCCGQVGWASQVVRRCRFHRCTPFSWNECDVRFVRRYSSCLHCIERTFSFLRYRSVGRASTPPVTAKPTNGASNSLSACRIALRHVPFAYEVCCCLLRASGMGVDADFTMHAFLPERM